MGKINKIKISGTSYDIEDINASKTVELTQAEYNALVSGGTVDPNTFYVITDATSIDLSQYYTSAQTNDAIASAVSGKADTTAVTTVNNALTAHTADTSIHVTSSDKTTWSGKQDALVSGTNIKTINNESILGEGNITIEGGGGGKAVSGGTFISVTTGETADTINCTIPAFFGSNNRNFRSDDIRIGTDISNFDLDYYRISIGRGIQFSDGSKTRNSIAIGSANNSTAIYSTMYARDSIAIGEEFNIGSSPNVFTYNCIGIGYKPKITNSYSTAIGTNVSAMTDYAIALGHRASVSTSSGVSIGTNAVASGTTKTNINNQLITDTSNQVYVYNKDNTEMIHLQDYIQFKIVKLTQTEYTNLQTKDANTLYIIVNDTQ